MRMARNRGWMYFHGRKIEITPAIQERLANMAPCVWRGDLTWDQAAPQVLGQAGLLPEVQLSLFENVA